jgi:hypothetical protein
VNTIASFPAREFSISASKVHISFVLPTLLLLLKSLQQKKLRLLHVHRNELKVQEEEEAKPQSTSYGKQDPFSGQVRRWSSLLQ